MSSRDSLIVQLLNSVDNLPEVVEARDRKSTNRRKMLEPRRRTNTDFSIRNICSESPPPVKPEIDITDDKPDVDLSSPDIKRRRLDEPEVGIHSSVAPVVPDYGGGGGMLLYPAAMMYCAAAAFNNNTTLTSLLFPPTTCLDLSTKNINNSKCRPSSPVELRNNNIEVSLQSSLSSSVCSDSSSNKQHHSPPAPTVPDVRATTTATALLSRKNYKNMTKQRRIEANARERSRVHTISAAFENLRRAVPSYSYNQRLSKLAILRIACSYIVALARLADLDYSAASCVHGSGTERPQMTFAECVDHCTQTIQSEGKAKRRLH